jgi:hypothetical protein
MTSISMLTSLSHTTVRVRPSPQSDDHWIQGNPGWRVLRPCFVVSAGGAVTSGRSWFLPPLDAWVWLTGVERQGLFESGVGCEKREHVGRKTHSAAGAPGTVTDVALVP